MSTLKMKKFNIKNEKMSTLGRIGKKALLVHIYFKPALNEKIVNIKSERNVDDLLLVKLSSPSELLKIRSYDN